MIDHHAILYAPIIPVFQISVIEHVMFDLFEQGNVKYVLHLHVAINFYLSELKFSWVYKLQV